jgi:hypothetical protein
VLKILRKKIKHMRPRIRICSNRRETLLGLADALALLFSIDSKVSGERFNGVGTKYFELTIQKKGKSVKTQKSPLPGN